MPYSDSQKQKAYKAEWDRRKYLRIHAEVAEYKVAAGCMDCGYNAHHAGLEFDHVGDDKEYNIAQLIMRPKKLWEEVAKCDVVCGTCHNIRTWNRKQSTMR